ncbi:MAG TPA: hypothetical protein VN622_07590, partial [Clostridia bacterium]|nr:hypothetical protein [Clostridia bacterium]
FRPREVAESRFYGGYDPEFLFRKVELLYTAYQHRDEFKRFVNAATGAENDESLTDQYFRGLAVEIHCSTFQQIESLFALLIAVFQNLPHWLYLSRYTNEEMLGKIKGFAAGHVADISGGACQTASQFVTKAIYAGVAEAETGPRWKRTREDLAWFLSEMATRYIKGRDEYNAYKHGLRMLPGDGAQLLVEVGRGTGDFRRILSMGHSLSYLEVEKRPTDYITREVTKEINPEDSFQAAYIMSEIATTACKIRLAVIRGEKGVETPTFEIDRASLVRLKPVARFALPF